MMRNDTELIAIPWHIQIFFSTFLYQKYQENAVKRLDGYLTFPQWLKTVESQPRQLEDINEIDDDEVIVQDFYFATIDWHLNWQFGSSSAIGNEYSTFEISLGLFTLIWLSKNEI